MRLNNLQLVRSRGLTLVELIVVIAIGAILAVATAVVLRTMAAAEKRNMDGLRVLAELEPLNETFVGLVRAAAADIDTGQDAFVLLGGGTELEVWTFAVENNPATRTRMARLFLSGNTLRVERFFPVAQAPVTVCRDVQSVKFEYGPKNTPDASASNYSGFRVGDNRRAILMTVTLTVDNETLTHKILAHAPNAKADN